MSMTTKTPLSTEILERNRDVWDAMQNHRFVRDIEEDQLRADVFRRYLVYERIFVETAMLIFGYAMVRASRLDQRIWLIGVLHALAGEQIQYFDRSFQALQILPNATRAALPASVNAFCSGMLGFARDGGYAEAIAAMLAAEWMYATWCTRAAKRPIGDRELRRWVDLHAAPEFSAQAAWLRREIDTFGESASQQDVGTLSAIFRRALELEIDFHSAPYREGPGI
jgi:thiaminase/transcriptional activator TenA